MFAVDASADGQSIAHGKKPGLLLYFLWMPQQTDLLHTEIVNHYCGYFYKVLLLFGYVIMVRLVIEAAVSPLGNMCNDNSFSCTNSISMCYCV